MTEMVSRKTWVDFRKSGLLWFINRTLHLFGWAIVVVVEADGSIAECYPAQVKFRGFDETSETEGFIAVTEHMAENTPRLLEEAKS